MSNFSKNCLVQNRRLRSFFYLILPVLFSFVEPACTGNDLSNKDDVFLDSLSDVYLAWDTLLDTEDLEDVDDRFIDSDKDGIPDLRENILGTDPFNPDTDEDGILDGDELKNKTDPLNPSSALKYHPEYNSSCKLFFDCESSNNLRETIKARVDDKREPYLTIFNRIKNISTREIPHYKDDFDPKISADLGEIAEANAFLFWLYEDNNYLTGSLKAILENFPDPTGVSASKKYNLYEAEALVSFCTAYEYLRASQSVDEASLLNARENIVKRIDYFREITHNGTYAVQLAYLNNNHKVKVLSAMGLCALLFNDRKESAFEISSAMTGIDYIMTDFQNADGFYAEGLNYLVYTDNSFLPFMYAYHRFSYGREMKFYGVENIAGGSPHTGKVVKIKDFVTNEKIINLYQKALFMTQPDGMMLPVDDANPSCLHGGIHYRIFNNKDFLWQWYKPKCGFNSNKLNSLTLLLLNDDKPIENPVSIPLEGSFVEGGIAILRDSFEEDSTFFAFIGENNKSRTNGLGHEHPDELSFVLWAYGQILVLDPGYINWDNHDLVKYSKDHSVILIDGEGSGYDVIKNQIGVNAYLTDIKKSGMTKYLSGNTSYKNSDIKRTIICVNDKYFLLLDYVKFGDLDSHKVSIQINGAGGGNIPNSAIELNGSNARYLINDVYLHISVLSSGSNLSFSTRSEEYAIVWGDWGYNDMLISDAEGLEDIYFLTLLLPSKKDSEDIYSESLDESLFYHSWMGENYEYFVVFNNSKTFKTIKSFQKEILVEGGLNIVIFSNDVEIDRTIIDIY